MKHVSISKTQYLAALRCEKSLWLELHGIPKPDPDVRMQYLFQMGHEIEKYAQALFPDGVHVGDGDSKFQSLLPLTKQKIADGDNTLFEAAFESKSCWCKSDILHKVTGNVWTLLEIKMCTKIKNEHYDDMGFQRHCLKSDGIDIDKTLLVYLNRSYNRMGDIDPAELFTAADMTDDVAAVSAAIPLIVKKLLKIVTAPVAPAKKIGTHCSNPYKCPYYDHCRINFPAYSIYELPYANRIVPELETNGITLIKDIPDGWPLSQRQSMYTASVKQGKPTINRSEIRTFLKLLKYPVYYLDFEAVSPPVPLWDNTTPFERVPFQFSLHIEKKMNNSPIHHFFLAESKDDPREELICSMLSVIGNSGSIVAYNASYEAGIIKKLADRFPKYADKLIALIPRVVDLIVPFRNGDYADYRFGKSVSLKSVLPVLVPTLTYDDMLIRNGDEASLAYEYYVMNKTDEAEWSMQRKALFNYCDLDSRAMVLIVERLRSKILR